MKKILIITYHYPSQNNGGSNGSKGFIKAFSELYEDCSIIYPENINSESDKYIPNSMKKYPCLDERGYIKKGIDVYRGRIHRFVGFVNSHLKKYFYDIIVVDHSHLAAGMMHDLRKSCRTLITIHHNVEADYVKDNLPNILYRYPYVYYSNKAEKDSLELSDINLTVTQHDADVFQSWYPQKNLHLYNLGNFEYFTPIVKHFPQKKFNSTFVISGSLHFSQSVEPIKEFISLYYPILKDMVNNANLIITGRNPNKELSDLCSKDSTITLIPNPENMEEVVSKADVYISPINVGSGRKLRVMDGLKLGMPILCHEVSAIGYEMLTNPKCIFTYNDEESFRNAVQLLCHTEFDADEIYKAYQSYFSLPKGIERLKNILESNNLL